MNFSIHPLPKAEIEIRVTLPFAELEPHVKKAAVLISEEVEIEGFRKGKAPYDIVKSRIGEQAIYERAADLAVRKTYPEVLNELVIPRSQSDRDPGAERLGTSNQLLVPIGRPEIYITKLAPGNELQYKVKTAIMPEVKLPDYKKIAQRVLTGKKEVGVNDEEVKKSLDWVREARAPIVTVSREAQKGDRVEIDFEIRHAGVKIENGESRNHPVFIGQGKFLPGFEDALIGMEAGSHKEFSLEIPPGWQEKNLAGKKLDFEVSMKLVQEMRLPDLTDEFARGLGNFKGAEDLRNNVREGMLREKEEKEKERVRVLMIEGIAKDAVLEIPGVLTDSEVEKMLGELKSGVGQMGVKWEDYLGHIKKTTEDLRKEWRGEAEKRVRIALCLREIAKLEKIEPGEEEIKERADQFLAEHQSAKEAQDKIDAPTLREYTRGILRNEKVFEFLEKVR